MDEGAQAEERGADLEEEGSGVAVLESKIRVQHFLYDRANLAILRYVSVNLEVCLCNSTCGLTL